MTEIFNSRLTLKYNDPDIEKAYQDLSNQGLKIKLIIFLAIVEVCLIIFTALVWISDKYNEDDITMTRLLASILTGIILVLLLIAIFVKSDEIKVLKVLAYITFYLLVYSDAIMRVCITYYIGADLAVIALIYTLEHLFALTWYYAHMIDFYSGFLLTVLKSVSLLIVFGPTYPLHLHFRLSVNQILMLIICSISYFYVYEQRKSFYYYKNVEQSKQWYQSILDNMRSGFLSFTDKCEIKYVNQSLLNYIDILLTSNDQNTIKYNCTDSNTLNKSFDHQSTLELLFKNQNVTSCSNPSGGVLDRIKDHLMSSSFNKFILIGPNELKIDNEDTLFEVYGRYYTRRQGEKKENNFEFLFNDITKIKSNEEIKAEFKFKSLFLAKVAHEFKNPILCITELADQIREKLEPFITIDEAKASEVQIIREIINNIKSMSDYLLILIKDMDFFSLKNLNINKLTVDKEYVNFKKLLDFLKDTTNVLLKKFNKQDNIVFNITYGTLPIEIYTDEIKLKQILLNLLSNAVKYTINGSITLELLYSNNGLINFIIRDTGKGLGKNKKEDIFKPYMVQNKEYNHIGAGLGLSIAKELVELLGGVIHYEPNKPEGSVFSFTIETIKYSTVCLSTIEKEASDCSANQTIEVDFYPTLNKDSMDLYYHRLTEPGLKLIPCRRLNIIIADDEVMTRKSTIRLIKTYASQFNFEITFLEASDGIECLSLYYQCFNKGEKISFIISDEYMIFMDGTSCAKAIDEISHRKVVSSIPFYLVTAYEAIGDLSTGGIDKVYSKPLQKGNLEEMFFKADLID
jgi:signal transduction histidine kinase